MSAPLEIRHTEKSPVLMARRKKNNSTAMEFSPAKRARKERSEKVRLAGSVFVITLLMGGGLAIIFLLNRAFDAVLFSKNDYFILRHLDAGSDGVLTPEIIRAYLMELGIEENLVNLFALDLKEKRRQFKAENVLVKDVKFERELPDTLRVSVVEPRPYAQLQGRTRLLLSHDSVILPSRRGGWTHDLPILVGFKNSNNLRPGDRFDPPMAKTSLYLLTLVKMNDPRVNYIKPLWIQPDYGENSLKIYLAANGPFRDEAQLVLPANPDKMNQALYRVAAIVQERNKARQTIKFLDATYEKNVPVRP